MLAGLLRKLLSLLLGSSPEGKESVDGFPAPPKILATITGSQLQQLLRQHGINLKCPLDTEYGLPAKSEYIRFLKWYRDNAPVKPSDYTKWFNCDAFAWIMTAYALMWMKGKCPFGYIEAASTDEDYKYPMHAFCFMVDQRSNVYFADQLEVAASADELDPAYEVYCQDAKV